MFYMGKLLKFFEHTDFIDNFSKQHFSVYSVNSASYLFEM